MAADNPSPADLVSMSFLFSASNNGVADTLEMLWHLNSNKIKYY